MVPCPQCGHQNLPSYSTCSRCGAALAAGVPSTYVPTSGASRSQMPTPGDPLALPPPLGRRRASGGPNRFAYAGILMLALGAMLFAYLRDRRGKAELQAKLDFAERWATIENDDVGAFWNCVMVGKSNIGLFANANQVQQRVEAAYASQPGSYGSLLRDECLPKLERARRAMAELSGTPPEFEKPLEAYRATLPRLATELEGYAEKVESRKSGKDLDTLIQEHGDKWHGDDSPSPEAIAYEKFLHCAIPGLARMKSPQAVLEHLADVCFKKDAVAFMGRVRSECGKLLENPTAKTPSKTWGLSKRFYEPDARQMQAWQSCSRRGRKGAKNEELSGFLSAFGGYMKARADFAQVGRDLAK